ncbi:MAG: CRTAC1 family protein [Pyrinomonadaceae bacterium]
MKLLGLALILSIGLVGIAGAQDGNEGGVSTGEAKAYSSRRTTGITDDTAPAVFSNVASQTALSSFVCHSGTKDKEFIIEATACTVAVFDYDNDGLPDIYLLNGSNVARAKAGEDAYSAALFKNLGNWKFKDVTAEAGVANGRWTMGVATADYNNDGFVDIFVGNYGKPRLYRNNGNGTFTDVAEKSGLAIEGWYSGATFGDFDKDGLLDLFIPSYLDFDLNKLPMSPVDALKNKKAGSNYCQFRGEPVMCGPRGLKGGKDRLFRQKAGGVFEEVGKEVGVTDSDNLYGFSSVFVDVDDDGDLDIVVVNDSTAKQLYINDKGKFEELGYPSGIALNENGREQAGMGLGVGDFDNDLRVDFHITNFSDDSNTLYRNDGEGNFTDITFQSGIGEASIPFLGWGTSFLDYNNDGWKDIFVGNGHVYPVVDEFQWGTSFAEQPLLFKNLGPDEKKRVKFERVGGKKGTALAESFVTRGIATGDFDGDGKVDVVMNLVDSGPALLKNVTEQSGNWLGVRLVGDNNVPRDGIGAVVLLTAGGLTQRQDMTSGAGYASQNEQVLRFGIGTAGSVEKIVVRWPNGTRESFKNSEINKIIVLKQGKGGRID